MLPPLAPLSCRERAGTQKDDDSYVAIPALSCTEIVRTTDAHAQLDLSVAIPFQHAGQGESN